MTMKRLVRKSFLTLLFSFIACAAFARVVEMRTDSSLCRIELDGARIISYRVNGVETLWNDDPPQTSAADWAHGGIPICWPNFGVAPDGKIHGMAWRRTFELLSRKEDGVRSEMLLELKEGDARLKYRIILADGLTLEMTTENAGKESMRCLAGFHPYFLVAERDRCRVEGVDGYPFEDDPSVLKPEKGTWRGSVPLDAAIDRIYALPYLDMRWFRLYDPVNSRVIAVGCEGATHVNIWNPGAEKRCPGKVPGDSWRRFACVEPIAIGGTAVTIPPGGMRTLKMTVKVEPKCSARRR